MTVPDRRSGSEPSPFLMRVIRATVPAGDGRALTDELRELYAARIAAWGPTRARRWLLRQTLAFVVRGGIERIADALRSMDTLGADARIALRTLRRNPAYTATFVLTLAMGTGVLATISTAAYWVLYRPVPGVRDAATLATLRLGSKESMRPSWSVSQPDLATLRERMPAFTGLAGATAIDVDIRWADGRPRRASGDLVTANFFDVLGTPFFAGSRFAAADDVLGGSPSVVVSLGLARTLSADPASLIGKPLRVNGSTVTITGITAGGFRGAELPGRAELWMPIAAMSIADPTLAPALIPERAIGLWRHMYGRVAAGATTADVAHQANGVMEAVRREFRPNSYSAMHFEFQAFDGVGLDPSLRASVRRTVKLLGIAAGLFLLLATANLMNLALMRASSRETATAIRYALGASSFRVARAVIAEMVLLGMAGGIVALGFGMALGRVFDGAQLAERGASLSGMHIDARVAAFTMVVALVSACCASLASFRAGRFNALEALLRKGVVGTVARHRVRMTLAGAQVAVSLMLVVTAGVLGRTVMKLRDIELGFSPGKLSMFALDPSAHGVSRANLGAMGSRIEQRIAAQPGVAGAGLISPAPFASSYFTGSLYKLDAPADARPVIGAGFYVSAGLLPALGVRVLSGDAHWAADSGTVVISRRALAELFPGVTPEQAAGRMVALGPQGKVPYRIAAIIEDVALSDITQAPPAIILKPLAIARPGLPLSVLVRSSSAPATILAAMPGIVADVAPDFSMFDVRTARSAIDLQFTERRILGLAAAVLAAFGLLLAAVGLYGVLAVLVTMRRRDIGVRSALGAAPLRIVSHVVSLGLVPGVGGVTVGVAGALAGSRLLASQVYGVQTTDPATYVAAVGVMVLAILAACLVPAMRAARVSPADVLRSD
jgi:predicted permease